MWGRPNLPPTIRLAPIWRRHPIASTLLLAVAVLFIYERVLGKLPVADDYTRYHNKVFQVVNVVDGDTFDIDIADREYPTTRIRLWGVDTPEVASDRSKGMYFGREASAFAKRRLMGRTVRVVLSPTRTRGLYGRLLAYVYLEPTGQMFNEQLIQNGYAYADWRFAHPYKRQFMTQEKRAQRAATGLWAQVTQNQKPPWRQRMENRRD